MRRDIVPGAGFPDCELPHHTDSRRRLSELQGEDPMILTLARGHYCPKEHIVAQPQPHHPARAAGVLVKRTRLTATIHMRPIAGETNRE